MSKSLHTIQTLAKLGRIFSQIIFICCLVGGIGSFVGIVVLLGADGLVIGGKDITAMFISESDIARETMIFACIAAFIASAAECVLSKFANVYFKHELASGTPFTVEGSKEILRLGILTIAIPMGALILEKIAFGVYCEFFTVAEQFRMEDMSGVGLGVMFIVASVIFRYGAELSARKSLDENE